MSQPARAVWIEIAGRVVISSIFTSQPARAVWIEIWMQTHLRFKPLESQPARAVWIEI